MDEILNQLDRFVHDKQFFTARYIDVVGQSTSQNPDVIAKFGAALFVLVALLHPNAHFIVNLLIVLIILLLTYIYRNERPNRDHLLVLWLCFSVMTLFDRLFEAIPLYYVAKVTLLMLLFLRPIRAVSSIKARLFNMRIFTPGVEPSDSSVSINPSLKK